MELDKIHIGLLIGYGLSGSGSTIYNLDLAKKLSEKGYKVSVFCHEFRDELIQQTGISTYDFKLKKGIIKVNSYLTIYYYKRKLIPLTYSRPEVPNGKPLNEFSSFEIKSYVNDMFDWINEKEQGVDHIFVHHLGIMNMVALKLKEEKLISYQSIVHGTVLEYNLKDSKRLKELIKPSLKKTESIIVLNKDVESRFVNIFPRLFSLCKTIPPGVDESLFHPNQTHKNKNSICFVGRQSFDKGIHCLLLSFHQLVLTDKIDVSLKISGFGPDIDILKKSWQDLNTLGLGEFKRTCKKYLFSTRDSKLAQKLLTPLEDYDLSDFNEGQILNQCQWVGELERKSIASLYRESSLAVLPSLVAEAHPLVVAESFCSGTPMIGINFSGIKKIYDELDLIDSEISSKLRSSVESKFLIKDLAYKMKNLIEAPLTAEELFTLRSFAVNNYSWDQIIEKLLAYTNDMNLMKRKVS